MIEMEMTPIELDTLARGTIALDIAHAKASLWILPALTAQR